MSFSEMNSFAVEFPGLDLSDASSFASFRFVRVLPEASATVLASLSRRSLRSAKSAGVRIWFHGLHG